MANAIDLKGVEEVLQQFEHRATPFYEVLDGKQLKFKFLEDDLEAAKACLELHLNQLANNGSTAPYRIVFYKRVNANEDGFIKDSEMGSNTFRLNQPGMGMQQYYAIQRGDIDPGQVAGMGGGINAKILETLNGINSRLTALETPLEEDLEESEEEQPQDSGKQILGALAGIIQHPDVQGILAQKLVGLLNLIPSGYMVSQPQQTEAETKQIQQMNEQEIQAVNQALGTLVSAGMTVADFQKLAQIASTDPGKFTMLLSMLKMQ